MALIGKSQADQTAVEIPRVALFEHNLWANQRLLKSCSSLTEQQQTAVVAGTIGSINDALQHLVRAETGYLNGLSGLAQYGPLAWKPNPDISTLQVYAQASGVGLIAAAARAQVNDLVTIEWDGRPRMVAAGLFLQQALAHAAEHRAEAQQIMVELGVEPPDLSGWAFMQAQSQQRLE